MKLSKIYSEGSEFTKPQQHILSATRTLAGLLAFDLTSASAEQKAAIKAEMDAILSGDSSAPERIAKIFSPNCENTFYFTNQAFVYVD